MLTQDQKKSLTDCIDNNDIPITKAISYLQQVEKEMLLGKYFRQGKIYYKVISTDSPIDDCVVCLVICGSPNFHYDNNLVYLDFAVDVFNYVKVDFLLNISHGGRVADALVEKNPVEQISETTFTRALHLNAELLNLIKPDKKDIVVI